MEATFEWSKKLKNWFMGFGFNEQNPIEYNHQAKTGSIITSLKDNERILLLFDIDMDQQIPLRITAFNKYQFVADGQFKSHQVCNGGMLWVTLTNNTVVVFNKEQKLGTQF